MKDFLGNEIEVGDKIVYPGRSGSSLWVTYSEVLEIKGNKLIVQVIKGGWSKGKGTINRTDRVTVVEKKNKT